MAKRTTNGYLKPYKSYLFRDKDPVIDELRTITRDAFGKIEGKTLRKIEEEGGPTVSCMRAWYFGVTRRPTNAAIEAAGRAIGKKRVWVNHK